MYEDEIQLKFYKGVNTPTHTHKHIHSYTIHTHIPTQSYALTHTNMQI